MFILRNKGTVWYTASMKTIVIGKENAIFQQILALKENRHKRAAMGQFFVEGVQNIKNAIAYDWQIIAFICEQNKPLSDWADSVLPKAPTIYRLSPTLFGKLSDKDTPSELLAVIRIKSTTEIVIPKTPPLYVLIDRPSKKGNFGTILRSCHALHVNQVFFTGHAVDLYDPMVITASMGSFFALPISFLQSNEAYSDVVHMLKQRYPSFQVVGTSLQADMRLQQVDFSKPTLLLIGNEAQGLSHFYSDTADRLVKIEMTSDIDSLNVACATSICLYEISRQRQ